jgi:hypothetical protein
MGATTWRYYTRYQPFAEVAFRELRADVFARGDNVQPPQVEDHWLEVAEPLHRWHARYLVVHRDGKPDEYAFVGSSGD